MEPEIIQRFLESVGRKADVDLYLKLFRSQRKESFAIIAAEAQVVREALDPFHFDLRILAGLGLTPVVLLGLFDARDADANAQRVAEWLAEDGVGSRRIGSGLNLQAEDVATIREAIGGLEIPLVSLQGAREASTEARFGFLQKLSTALETRKVIFLSTSAGLGDEAFPRISVVNLNTDYEHVLASGGLSRRQAQLLRRVKALLAGSPHRMSAAVVNPLDLLRELFTVGGAGTLIRQGSRIDVHSGLATVDRPRLENLIESAFGKKLRDGALDQDWARVYVEENYRGAALLTRSPVGMYLSKFAVERQAQGEGIGGDLWTVMVRDFPSIFWRARPDNPITSWYMRKCDGLVRLPHWHVFWCGLAADAIKPAVDYAASLPADLATGPALSGPLETQP